MFETNVWCYPWDLVDEGVDAVLDRLQGEAGATGISLAVTYHSLDQIRPHAGEGKARRFVMPGGTQFQPDASHYGGTSIKPVVAAWLKKSNPLKTIAEGCRERGLKLRAWTVCCHGTVVVSRYPDCAVRDAFGDMYPHWLCPVNPNVRTYLRALVQDLTTNHPFDVLELERPSFDAKPHSHSHYKIGFDAGEAGRFLQALCFCSSCVGVANDDGVDADAAMRSARVWLERIYAKGEPLGMSPAGLLEEDEVLRAYADWRCGKVTSLVGQLRKASSCPVVVHRVGDAYFSATRWDAIAGQCDGLLAHYWFGNPPADLHELIGAVARETGDPSRVELGLNATTPPIDSQETLVSTMGEAAQRGVRSVDIYNYGLLTLNRMDWIRKAARFAQREAGGA